MMLFKYLDIFTGSCKHRDYVRELWHKRGIEVAMERVDVGLINQMIEPGKWRNKKTSRIYEVVGCVLNATNAMDGQIMVHYGETFVREIGEFKEKFEKVQN